MLRARPRWFRWCPMTFLAMAVAASAHAAGPPLPPNIILVLADDLGWTDLSGGSTSVGHASDLHETPNLDELAREGVSFTNAYSNGANCAPTRASLLSGLYPPRHGVYSVNSLDRGNRKDGVFTTPLRGAENRRDLAASFVNIAELLQRNGYATAHVGKYHVGGHEGGGTTMPQRQGFDRNYGGGRVGHPGGYHADEDGAFGRPVGPELDAFAEPGDHLTDASTDAALEFIQTHRTRPFFLHLAYHAVHTPIRGQGRRDLVKRFDGKKALHDGGRLRHQNADYAALLAGIDEGIRCLREQLETTTDADGRPLAERTLIVFTSDNGGLIGPVGPTDNTPLRGQKGEFHEGGIRVPFIAWMPAHIRAGSVRHVPIASIDLYPTFAAFAGIEIDPAQTLDGVNLRPILTDPGRSLAPRALFWHFPGYLVNARRDIRPVSVIRRGRWKLVHHYEDARIELYDLETDLSETRDRSGEQPAVARDLATALRRWLISIQADRPVHVQSGAPAAWPGEADS